MGIKKRFAYCATKGAIVAMTRQLAVDYATQVRVNCICPGTVDTPFVEGYLEKYHKHEKEKVRAELNLRQPVGRLGKPDEIAHLALYLASTKRSSCKARSFRSMADGPPPDAPRRVQACPLGIFGEFEQLQLIGASFDRIRRAIGSLGRAGSGVEAARRDLQDRLVFLQRRRSGHSFQQQIGQHLAHGQQRSGRHGMLVDGILMVGGSAQQPEALVLLPFGECDQRGRGFPLRADRAAPIVVAGCRQRLANGRDFFGRAARRRRHRPRGLRRSPSRNAPALRRFGTGSTGTTPA